MHSSRASAASLLFAAAAAVDLPDNIRKFRDSIVNQGQCSNPVGEGFHAIDGDNGDTSYCGDHLNDFQVMYLQGTGGALADMDVDCDGRQDSPANDGRCTGNGDTQPQTAFDSNLQDEGYGIDMMDANIHPYVVFGNVNDDNDDSGWNVYNPSKDGIKPLSLIAVVCGDQLIYGIWGDENGSDGDESMIGEASISLATACFGTDDINDESGHTQTDVLYIAFAGDEAVPGADGANWAAGSYQEFEDSITDFGNNLIKKITGAGSVSPPTNGGGDDGGGDGGDDGCSWEGHCEGDSCGSDDDCSDSLACVDGACANE